jgi:hypothetical protein
LLVAVLLGGRGLAGFSNDKGSYRVEFLVQQRVERDVTKVAPEASRHGEAELDAGGHQTLLDCSCCMLHQV